MTVYDKLLLLSPRTWFGVLHQMQESPFVPFRIEQLLQSILGILIPLLVLSLAKIDPRIIIPLSPWTFGLVQSGIVGPVQQIAETCHLWKTGRRNPLPSALTECLQDRIESGRCRRFNRYDVFLPPPPNNSTNNNSTNNNSTNNNRTGHATLFLPGALVSHVAYCSVAAKLSDHGICVVTVSMEPSRMATEHLGADAKRMKRIMKHVGRIAPIQSWSIGGHSMGSFGAMRLAKPLDATSLFLWGAANFPQTRTNLSTERLLPVLVLQGSNDAMCAMTEEELADFQSDFPTATTAYQTIQGAAHNWFASVEEGNPAFCGKASISMDQQQEEAARLTAEFLLKER